MCSDLNEDGIRFLLDPFRLRLLCKMTDVWLDIFDDFLELKTLILSKEPFEGLPSTSGVASACQREAETSPNRFHFNGVMWEISFEGDREKGIQLFKGKKGFYYWARLLAHPYTVFKPIDFIKADLQDVRSKPSPESEADKAHGKEVAFDDSDVGERLWSRKEKRMDATYITDLKNRVRGLQSARHQAVSSKNDELLKCLDNELNRIEELLRRDINIRGVIRNISTSEAEKQRKSVCNALERARNSIADKLPSLAVHLDRYRKSGSEISYDPPGNLSKWHVDVRPSQ